MTNSKLSLLSISIVLPVLKSRCIITYTRVNFLKTGKGCNDVSVMSLQDIQLVHRNILLNSSRISILQITDFSV